MLINRSNYPTLFRALENIDFDNGVTPRDNYELPDRDYSLVEDALRKFTDYEFETFCIGEERDMRSLAYTDVYTLEAHQILEDYFNGH